MPSAAVLDYGCGEATSADVIAAGASNDVGLTKLAPGRQIVVPWRGSPILVVRHTRAMVAPPFAA